MKKFNAFILSILFSAISPAQPVISLTSGFVRTPGAPSPVLYVARGTSLFRSTDDGANWRALYITEPGLPQPALSSLIIDPRNPAILYAGTALEQGLVWKSTNAGDTWARITNGLPQQGELTATHLTIPSAQQQSLYVKVGTSLYKSLNGGETWTLQSNLPGNARAFWIHSANPSRMYTVESGGSIHSSANEGASWTRVAAINLAGTQNTGVSSVVTNASDANRIFVGVVGGFVSVTGIYMSTDGGQNIDRIRPSQTVDLIPDPTGRSIIYEVGSTGGMARSRNNGQTWTISRASPEPEFTSRISIDPNSPDTVYVSNSRGLFRSTNGGDNFTMIEGRVRGTLAKPVNPLVFGVQEGERGSLPISAELLESPTTQIPFTAATGGQSWLRVTPTSGNTRTTLTVSVDTAGLAPGTYNGTIRLSSPQTVIEHMDIPVRLVVSPRGVGGPPFTVSTVAGDGRSGLGVNGAQATATSLRPGSLALDAGGNLFVADRLGDIVYRVDRAGVLTRFAGTGTSGFSGDGGPAVAAQINSPTGIGVDSTGRVFISDWLNNRVRMVTSGTISTIASSENRIGSTTFRSPRGMAVRADDRIAVLISFAIALLTPPNIVTGAFSAQPRFSSAEAIAIDPAGNYIVADTVANQIFRVDRTGEAAVIAGNGVRGYTGDGPQATNVALNSPSGVAVDRDGNIYFSDTGNHRVRLLTPDGAIVTIAGTGESGFDGDGGAASQARFSRPTGLAVDSEGNIFVADESNNRVRKLTRVRVPVPQVSDNSFVHAADGSPRLSAGSLFSLFGSDLGQGEQIASSAPWPIALAGASVFVNNRASPLYFNNSRQVNGQIPFEIQPGPATVRVEVAGTRSREIRVNIVPAAPGILQFGDRRAVAVNPDGSVNTADNPIAPGAVLLVYLSGIGPLDNPVATGAAASANPLSRPTLPFSAMLGDQPVELAFLGLAPGFVALAQANFVVPELPPGTYEFKITVGGNQSNSVFVTIGT
jgi:uncharacterized protein (TIGR03437 family)